MVSGQSSFGGAWPRSIKRRFLPASVAAALVLSSLLALCEAAEPAASLNIGRSAGRVQSGEASVYVRKFHGRKMVNGERFDSRSNSAAHRTLPLGTRLRVTNLENGRSAAVTIEDRGPYVRGRIIDVSPRTAEALGMQWQGVVAVEIVSLGSSRPSSGRG